MRVVQWHKYQFLSEFPIFNTLPASHYSSHKHTHNSQFTNRARRMLLLLLFAVLSCMSPKGWYTFVLPLLVRATEDDNRAAHVWCLGKYHKFQKPLMGCVCSALAIKTEMNTDRMKNGSSTFRRDTQFCSAYFSTLVLQYKPNKQGNSSSLHLHNWIICNKYRMRESHAYHAQPTPIDTRRY